MNLAKNQYIKFTCAEGRAVYGVGGYPKLGEWTGSEEPDLCYSGWHVCARGSEHVWLRAGNIAWVAEARGKSDADDNKIAFESIQLVRKLRLIEESVVEDLAWDALVLMIRAKLMRSSFRKKVWEAMQHICDSGYPCFVFRVAHSENELTAKSLLQLVNRNAYTYHLPYLPKPIIKEINKRAMGHLFGKPPKRLPLPRSAD